MPTAHLFISCFASALLLGPSELSSQSWLTYRGSIDGKFAANCPTPAGGFARKQGPVRFNFYDSGNDAKTRFVSEWYPNPGSPRTATGEEKIDAGGSASGGGIYLVEGGTIRWEGKFQRANDGSAQGSTDLTGLWLDDSGGGAVYRVRQVGTRFYWTVDGTSKGSYVNLAFGDITGNTINAKWVDLPGSPTLGGGDISLRIESNNRLVKISSSATYAPQAWTRQGTAPATGGGNPPGIASGPAIASGRYLRVRLNGARAIVDWSNAPTSSGSWVSIVPIGTPDGTNAGRWIFTADKAAGSFENGPLGTGAWEARFYSDGGYTQLVDRVRFDVGAAAMRVVGGAQGQILRVEVDGRAFAIVTWSNAPTSDGVWVSVVPVGTPDGTHVGKWTYTNRTATGKHETGPLSAGEYEARVYGDSGYGRIIERVRFRVQ